MILFNVQFSLGEATSAPVFNPIETLQETSVCTLCASLQYACICLCDTCVCVTVPTVADTQYVHAISLHDNCQCVHSD